MGTTALLTILTMGLVALVGWRGFSRYWRRTHDAAADLTVSESWLAEQRGRRDER